MREESERSLRFTSPELSPTLVLVLKCLTVAHLVCPPTITHITTHTISLSQEIQITIYNAMLPGHQQVTSNTNSSNNNNNSLNSIVNFITGIDEEERQILQWLSPLEPRQRHQGVRTDRLDGVGNWVLKTSEFRNGGR